MLSQHAINGCGRALQWFYTIGVSPLRWDRKDQRQRIHFTQSTLRLVVLALNMCLYGLYGLNNTWSLLERSVNDSFFGKSDLAFNFLWFCCFTTTPFSAWSTLRNRNEIAAYINQFIRLHKGFSGRYCHLLPYSYITYCVFNWRLFDSLHKFSSSRTEYQKSWQELLGPSNWPGIAMGGFQHISRLRNVHSGHGQSPVLLQPRRSTSGSLCFARAWYLLAALLHHMSVLGIPICSRPNGYVVLASNHQVSAASY